MLKAVNICLSNRCTGKCVFCPKERGRKGGVMSLEVADKLIADSLELGVKKFDVGENGDALLNPNFQEILKRLRERIPDSKVNLTTNFAYMTAAVMNCIIGCGIVDSMQVNVDGHDEESYWAQKGLPYKRVMDNLRYFASIMGNFPLGVNVLTAWRYYEAVKINFGVAPLNAPKAIPYSSVEMIRKSLSFLPSHVPIKETVIFGWAERENHRLRKARGGCPQLPRIENEAFIAPNGSWYACCLDAGQDLVLGNIMVASLREIGGQQQRAWLIGKLKQGKFDEIGYPCSTHSCCEVMA